MAAHGHHLGPTLRGDRRSARDPGVDRYAHYIQKNLPNRPLREWAKARAIDQIDTLYWLYNRTGDASLLETADLLQDQSNHWDTFFSTLHETGGDFFSAHNVNVTQAMKFSPVVYPTHWCRRNERERFLMAWELLERRHGLPTGMGAERNFCRRRRVIRALKCAASWNRCSAARSPSV